MIIRVAIVDDHQLFIDGIKSILSTEVQIEIVAEANDGVAMLRLLREQPRVDVLISDIRMPGMDGLCLTREVRKLYPNISILILSMFDQRSDVEEIVRAGAQGYLPKNIGRDTLVEAIYKLHKGRRYFPNTFSLLEESPDIVASKEVNLTKREKQILSLLAKGRTSIQISQELHISKLTVDTHRKNMHRKLGLSNYSELLIYAIAHNA